MLVQVLIILSLSWRLIYRVSLIIPRQRPSKRKDELLTIATQYPFPYSYSKAIALKKKQIKAERLFEFGILILLDVDKETNPYGEVQDHVTEAGKEEVETSTFCVCVCAYFTINIKYCFYESTTLNCFIFSPLFLI